MLDEILAYPEEKLRTIDVSHFKTFSQEELLAALVKLPSDNFNTLVRVYFGFDRAHVYHDSQDHLLCALIQTYHHHKNPIPAVLCKYIIENGIPSQNPTQEILKPYYAGFFIKCKDYDLYPDQYVNLVFRNQELENQFIYYAAEYFKEGKILPYKTINGYPYEDREHDRNLSALVRKWREKYHFNPAQFNYRETLIAIHRDFLLIKRNVDNKKIGRGGISGNAPTLLNCSISQDCNRIPIILLKEYLLYALHQTSNSAHGYYFTDKSLVNLVRVIINSKKSADEKQSIIDIIQKFLLEHGDSTRIALHEALSNIIGQYKSNQANLAAQPNTPGFSWNSSSSVRSTIPISLRIHLANSEENSSLKLNI